MKEILNGVHQLRYSKNSRMQLAITSNGRSHITLDNSKGHKTMVLDSRVKYW